MKRYWMGPVPTVDDFGYPVEKEFIDGATTRGPGAIMTPARHTIYGRGLGTGRGQRYQLQADGRWLKVEG